MSSMNADQKRFARKQAFGAAGIPAADLPAAETAYWAAFNEAESVGLADEKAALRSALNSREIPAGKLEQAIAVYSSFEKDAEERPKKRRREKIQRMRKIVIASLVAVLMVCVLVVIARQAMFDDAPQSGPSAVATSTPTVVPTVHAVIDRPLDANGTPPAP